MSTEEIMEPEQCHNCRETFDATELTSTEDGYPLCDGCWEVLYPDCRVAAPEGGER